MAEISKVVAAADLVSQNPTNMESVTHLWMKVYKKLQPVLPPASK